MKELVFEIARQKWRQLSIILALLLINILLVAVMYAYQMPSISELQTEWGELRRKVAQAGQVDAAILHRQGAADLEKLKLRIPQKREFARLLSGLLESAEESGVEVGAISYKPVQIKEESLLSYQLSLPVSGSYAAVKSYLADLQKIRELIVVDMVTFSNSDMLVENVVMDLRISVYLREGA